MSDEQQVLGKSLIASRFSSGDPAKRSWVFRPSETQPTRGTSPGIMAEWLPSYNPTYPHNDVKVTESGHALEFDDSPNAERIHIYHRSGAHIELRPDGRVKYKATQSRQDVTIADHEIMVSGDYRLSVGGNVNIRVREGTCEIQADHGMAVNVHGQLKMNADEINFRAKNKITLAAPNVDIGGSGLIGSVPYLSLPTGIVPIFGVIVPRFLGMISPASVLAQATPISVPASLVNEEVTLGNLASKFKQTIAIVGKIGAQISAITAYAAVASAGISLAKQLLDKDGNPALGDVAQPEEFPLSNPRVYNGITDDRYAYRARLFDEPKELEQTESYTAHLNLCEELGDFVGDQRDLPGQPVGLFVDTETLAAEPPPWTAYRDSGTITFEQGSTIVRGNGTKFLRDYAAGGYLTFESAPFSREESTTVFPRIATIVDDETLVLASAYSYPTAANVVPYSFRLRPFAEYVDRTEFPPSTPLGNSGYTLEDFMVNYLPPVEVKPDVPLNIDPVVSTPQPEPVSTETPQGLSQYTTRSESL